MPIAKTPIKTTIEIPPYIMASIDVTAIKVFLFPETLVKDLSFTVVYVHPRVHQQSSCRAAFDH